MAENLRGRVAAAAGTTPGTDVAPVAPRPKTIVDEIRAMQAEFQVAMPRGAEAEQLIRDAITAVRTTKNLDQCDAQSVLGGLMTCAQLGLRPGVLGQAWLLPFWDANFVHPDNAQSGRKGGYRAQFVPGYQGLVALAYRSPQVATVMARTVRAGETFEVDYGIADTLIHKPLMDGVPGEPIAYYSFFKGVNGGHAFYVMTRPEAENYRDRYAPRNRSGNIVGPWATEDAFDGMAQKSCLRQLSKWMPKSTELAVALEADGRVRTDLAIGALEGSAVIDGEVESDTADTDQQQGGQ